MSLSRQILISFKRRLHEVFPDYHIYSMSQAQGIREPCFMVRVRNTTAKTVLGRKAWYASNVEIVALPAERPTHETLQDVREEMLFTLDDFLMEDRYLRAENAGVRIVDDAVHYEAKYEILVEKPRPEEPMMEDMEHLIYTDEEAYNNIPKYEDQGMWKWREYPAYTSEEEEGLMEEIENERDLTP